MSHLPCNWPDLLPRAFDYYSTRIEKLGPAGASGIAQGKCPLHADEGASLSVNLNTGHWHCRHCGRGVMTVFHQRLTGMMWAAAVDNLIGIAK